MRNRIMARVALVALAMLVVGVFVACSGGGKEDEATALASDQTQTTDQKQTTYGRAVDKAKVVVAELSNPKVGTDPVCGMAIDETAVIVEIDGKKYGVCSQKCADALMAEPEKYLMAAADHDDHEGHDH